MDPLAVLMSRVWVTPIDINALMEEAGELIEQAEHLTLQEVKLHWIDSDQETADFIEFWFGEHQRNALRKLAFLLQHREDSISDALRVALSRIIITKDNGASLARDVSHSRPHRVKTESEFDVYSNFLKSIKKLSTVFNGLSTNKGFQSVNIARNDARNIPLKDYSIDYVLTSPPYLNAIDYLRGHKLALVWFGYKISDLRNIRSSLVGAEKALKKPEEDQKIIFMLEQMSKPDEVNSRMQGIMKKFAYDMGLVISEIARVLKKDGLATLIVGNCNIQGTYFNTARLMEIIANQYDLTLIETVERPLNPTRRYLPPPKNQISSLSKRMSSESILTFVK